MDKQATQAALRQALARLDTRQQILVLGHAYQARVRDRARQILATHQPEPLSAQVAARLEEIMALAEAKLAQVEFVA